MLSKCDKLVKKNCIVMLQETHLTNMTNVKSNWKAKFVESSFKSNSAGVLTLFNNDFETIYEDHDDKGQQSYVIIKNNIVKLLVVNIYIPNDHRVALSFIEEVYLKIHEILNKNADCNVILGGDMNACMTREDCLNRCWNRDESILANTILQNNKTCDLSDAYRCMNSEGGFTWNKNDCYSRLDHLFVTNPISQFIIKASTDWGFDKSDHAAVKIDLAIPNEPVKGPGIIRVNTQLLDDPFALKN
jgi:exonuclease III